MWSVGLARERGHQGVGRVVGEGEEGGRAGGRAERRERARAHFWVEERSVGGGGVGMGNGGAKGGGMGWGEVGEDRESR